MKRHYPSVAAMGAAGGPVPVAPPAWVLALQAPSGANPMIALDWENNRYWAQDGAGPNGFVLLVSEIITQNLSWGVWNAAAAISAGNGLKCNNQASWTLSHAYFPPSIQAAGVTVLSVVKNAPPNGSFEEFKVFLGNLATIDDEYYFYTEPNEDGDGILTAEIADDFFNHHVSDDQASVYPAGTAMTVNFATHCSLSNQGAAVVTCLKTSPSGTLTDFYGQSYTGSGSDTYMALYAIYPPQPDANLPAICALR